MRFERKATKAFQRQVENARRVLGVDAAGRQLKREADNAKRVFKVGTARRLFG